MSEDSATMITITHKSPSIITIDANNVMILAPSDVDAVSPANYSSEEHIGNLCREHAKLIAKYMDFGSFSLYCDESDCNQYSDGYLFTCTLLESTNHTATGYEIQINVWSNNSKMWIDSFYDILLENNINPEIL